jgi:hypothetical protein
MVNLKTENFPGVVDQWIAENRRARRKGRLPVLAVVNKDLPGRLLIVHEIDLEAVAAAHPSPAASRP